MAEPTGCWSNSSLAREATHKLFGSLLGMSKQGAVSGNAGGGEKCLSAQGCTPTMIQGAPIEVNNFVKASHWQSGTLPTLFQRVSEYFNFPLLVLRRESMTTGHFYVCIYIYIEIAFVFHFDPQSADAQLPLPALPAPGGCGRRGFRRATPWQRLPWGGLKPLMSGCVALRLLVCARV